MGTFHGSWKANPGLLGVTRKKRSSFCLSTLQVACSSNLVSLGKTSATLAAIKFLKKRGLISKVLIVAPLRVCYSVWPREIEKWDDFRDLTYTILHGSDKEDNLEEDVDIYLVNPEGLDWLLKAQKTKTAKGKTRVDVDLRRWKKLGFDTLVVDELSKFKHTQTNRFKGIKHVLPTFQRIWGLTGSPAANGLMDLFGQCYILDQGRTLGPYITHYRMKYFDKSYDGYSWVLREGAEKEIYQRLKPLVLSMKAEDHLDMPAVVENNIIVDLPEDVMEIYRHLEDDLIAKIEDKVVVATNAAAASTKCRQVANGGVYIDQEVEALVRLPKTKRDWVDLHTAKVDALADLVEELQGSPILVAYDFGHDLARIQEKFGKDVPYIGGGVTPKRSTQLEQMWNNKELPILFGHPQSIGHGLNLQEAGNHVAWLALTWNYELYDQFIRRVLRQGNASKRVFVHHFIAKGTIDHAILAAVKSKKNGQNALFQALKGLRRRS